MKDLIATSLVLAGLIGVYVLMLRSARSGRGAAKSFGAMRYYKESSWGVAMLSGFAVTDILKSLSSYGGTTSSLGDLASLAATLAMVVGFSCGLGAEKSVLVAIPATIVGAVAAVLTSVQLVRDSLQSHNWLILSMVFALGLLFGVMAMGSIVAHPSSLKGLAWYTAIELLIFLSSPFGVSVTDLAGVRAGVLVMLQIALPIALAWMPGIVINLFACGVVFAKVAVSFLTNDGWFGGSLLFAVLALVAYTIGVWMRRGFGGKSLRGA